MNFMSRLKNWRTTALGVVGFGIVILESIQFLLNGELPNWQSVIIAGQSIGLMAALD